MLKLQHIRHDVPLLTIPAFGHQARDAELVRYPYGYC